jgi:hypothetical protein
MKAQILKIAGVKSEKEFYKKFPTEAAFKKAHGKELKKAQLGASIAPEIGSYTGGDMDKNSPLAYRELYDDVDLSITGSSTAERIQLANLQAQQAQAQAAQKEANKKGIMDAISAGMGKNGKKVKKAQTGLGLNNPAGGSMTNPNPNVDMWGNPLPIGGGAPPSTPGNPYGTPMLYDQGQMGTFAQQATAAKGAVNPNANPSPVGSYISAGLDIVQGISQLKGEKDALNLAKQSKMVSDVSLRAANTRPEQTKRRYVRPEDMAFGTEEMGQSYGIGTNYLARNGSVIGGNPTEIQNTYAPYNTLYSDLGYEPLEDDDQVKQYRAGGMMAQDGWVTRAANAEFSCRANPRKELRAAKSAEKDEIETTSGGRKDPDRDLKNARWKAQGSQWENQGITKEDFNNAFNDSSRMGNTFMNPEYAKYFDPANGKIKPEYESIRNNINPRVKYYAQSPSFPMGQRATVNNILGLQMSQPGGMEGYRELIKNDYAGNVSPFIQSKREGGLIEAQGGFNWSNFAQGGGSSMAGNLGQFAGSGKPGPNAGSSIGKGIGSAAGTAIGGPVGGMIGGFLGGAVGGLIDGKPRQTAKFNEQTQGNMGNIAVGAGARGLQQGQYSGFMENGGWMNPEYNPQVIAKFGDHTAQDYYNAGHEGMESLRAGGHLTNYTPPSEEAMETFALGGELKTLWGGHAEPISQNPYLPGSGETIMFKGQSHDNGGIGVSYGNKEQDSYTDYAEYGTEAAMDEADVEVEGGEPMVELEEGGQIDPMTGEAQKAGVVYGNLVLNKKLAKEHSFGKEAGRKMKHIVRDWSKGEAKQNKIIEKSLNMVENGDDSTAFGQLAFATAKAMQQGANMKLKKYANDKIVLAGIQSALNDTAKEHGVVADDLAKGKIKIDKSNNDMAKFGASLRKAQGGDKLNKADSYSKWKEFENAAISKLRSIYPGKKVELRPERGGVYNDLGGRDISTQAGIRSRGNSKTPVSLHNFNAAKDYNIYIDGKLVNPEKNKDFYSQILWDSAAKTGLYHVGDNENNWDPRHIGLAKEGEGTAFDELYSKYPEIFDNPNSKKSLEWLSKHRKDDPEIEKYYNWATNIKPFGDSAPKFTNDAALPGDRFPEYRPTVTLPDVTLRSKTSPNNAVLPNSPFPEYVPTRTLPNNATLPNSPFPEYRPTITEPEVILRSKQKSLPIIAPATVDGKIGSGKKTVTAKNQPVDPYVPKYVGRGEANVDLIPIDSASKRDTNIGTIPVPETVAEQPQKPKRDWGKTAMMAYNEILPWLRPNYKVGQPDFTGEMMAASMNQQEPVQAQLFHPHLGQPYDISFQDQLNANQADYNALQRTTGYNPAAGSALAAQKYAANSAILAGQFRANQGERSRVYEENRKLMDQADLTNLGILDKQYERQATAKSKTKTQAIEIAKSISDKLAQQRKEQAMSNIEQSRYNYRFDSNGRPINMNPLAMWNTSGIGGKGNGNLQGMTDEWMTLYDQNGQFQGTKLKTKKQQQEDGSGKNGIKIKARNGSIVKAIKNL